MCVPSQNRCDECKQPLTHLRATPAAYHIPWPSIFMNQLAHFHLDFQEFIYPIYKQNPSSLCLHFHRTSKLVIQKILHRFQAQLSSWRIKFPLIIRPLNKAPLLYVPFSNPQMYDRILVTNAIKKHFYRNLCFIPTVALLCFCANKWSLKRWNKAWVCSPNQWEPTQTSQEFCVIWTVLKWKKSLDLKFFSWVILVEMCWGFSKIPPKW